MATRSTTHFVWKGLPHTKGERVIIYVHHDGYPSEGGKRVLEFLEEVGTKVQDVRFEDASLTAARFVSFMFDRYYKSRLETARLMPKYFKEEECHPLGSISIRILQEDPGDIEFRYEVFCDELEEDGLPRVVVYDLHQDKEYDLKELRQEGWER